MTYIFWGLICTHYTTYKADNQQGPSVSHRELDSIFCNNLCGKRIWKRMNIPIYITESLYTWNEHNIINQLYSNIKFKWRKRLTGTENELTVAGEKNGRKRESWGWTCTLFYTGPPVAQGTLFNVMWQPGGEGSLGESGYVYTYGWVPLPFTWNYHNIVSQVNLQYKIKNR